MAHAVPHRRAGRDEAEPTDGRPAGARPHLRRDRSGLRESQPDRRRCRERARGRAEVVRERGVPAQRAVSGDHEEDTRPRRREEHMHREPRAVRAGHVPVARGGAVAGGEQAGTVAARRRDDVQQGGGRRGVDARDVRRLLPHAGRVQERPQGVVLVLFELRHDL